MKRLCHSSRSILFTGAVAGMLGLLAGCGSANASGPSAKPTLQVAIFSGPEAEQIAALAPQYTKKTGVKIQFVKLSYTTLFSKNLVSASASQGTYDLIFMDDPWIPTFAGGGYLYPLSHFHYKPTGFLKGALQVDQWPPSPSYKAPLGTKGQKQYYAVPVTGNVLTLFYNSTLLKKAHLSANPQHFTWQDINKLAAASYHPSQGEYGYVMRGKGGNSGVADFSPILWAYGGHYFHSNWTSALNSPQAVAALKEWVTLYHYGPSGQTAFGANQVGTYMEKNNTAAALVWPSGWAPQMPSDVKVTLVPGTTGSSQYPEIGVWSLGIPKNAPHPNTAFKFLQWISAKNQQMHFAASGLDVPTMKSVILNPALDKKWPYYVPVAESIQMGHMRPRTPAWPEVEQVLGSEMVKAEQGQVSPAKALQTAAAQINQYMKQHNLSK